MNNATTVNLVKIAHFTKCIVLLSVIFSGAAFPGGSKTTYQTLPNSNVRDYRAPAFVTEGNTTYQTLPGSTVRDYRAPSYVTKDDTIYRTLPCSSVRDYSAPSYISKQRMNGKMP